MKLGTSDPRKATKSETDIEGEIIDSLRDRGYMCWKNMTTGIYDPTTKTWRKLPARAKRGVSDIIVVLYGGVVVWLEVKTVKGRQSEAQIEFEADIVAKRGHYFVVRSEGEAIAAVLSVETRLGIVQDVL